MTIKNCYSPAGMSFSTANLEHTNEIDCPSCKYGTLDRSSVDTEIMCCIDCKREYTLTELRQLGILSKAK